MYAIGAYDGNVWEVICRLHDVERGDEIVPELVLVRSTLTDNITAMLPESLGLLPTATPEYWDDEKHCPTCDTTKKVTEFAKRTASPDGLKHECKTCSNDRVTAWRKNG